MSHSQDDGSRRIGENVRAARVYRGLSIETAAGLVGRSKSWLSKIENGHLRLERRSDIRALAEALEVSATDLLGEPVPAIRPKQRQLGDVIALREVLLDSSLEDPVEMPVRPLSALAALVAGPIAQQRRASDYPRLTAVLPGILAELHVHAATGDERQRRTALGLLVDMCVGATFVLRHLGQTDLAWIAADRAERAARLLDDPVSLGTAVFAQAHSRPSAALSRALREAGRHADRLEPHIGDDRRAFEVYGMLRLSAALAEQVRGRHAAAAEHAAEAQRIASRIGEHLDAWQSFGPANTGVWRTMLAVEAGEPEAALQAAQQVDAAALPSQGRRAALAIERARARAMSGDAAAAVRELRQAEKLSAARVHRNPLVRELVADLYDRAPGRDLRGLAWRMNLA
ncbi:Transcriptional regulator, contains XRE-family HTH domain [Thermomonospora echinospora]|uniref:Transcriptional regulator, contains XRE-family HTH domain n=1 Tax=Thermomonospora echinospora TaxID=1992 RepID=A0A1H6D9Z9_9ACTN|nr:helix-turn-helix transcriptional regulator [Thermomonospora echinospora]SEG82307.1 Transcriptional regulator, contains XRE-family HTH domain [Thermomonospora echinospora]